MSEAKSSKDKVNLFSRPELIKALAPDAELQRYKKALDKLARAAGASRWPCIVSGGALAKQRRCDEFGVDCTQCIRAWALSEAAK